ncbi:WEB family protein [Zostera marina]|uniref:WEB family protein n=1 Tax=Zostera marina TaxID=29655 RepID=A0A0K9PAM5_ZOSMR|nr:WEB family protein [Zostera marina]
METKVRHLNNNGKPVVGEIDTSAPFESVKEAVNLFGEGAFSFNKPILRKQLPKSPSSETLNVKETQLRLAEKELNKYKEQLKSCELAKVKVLDELDTGEKTVNYLTEKLKIIDQSREEAAKVTETEKLQTKELQKSTITKNAREELDSAQEKYAIFNAELDSAKQDLRMIRKQLEVSMNAKVLLASKEKEAKRLVAINKEQAEKLLNEIAFIQESTMHVNLACSQAREEESKILSDKDAILKSYKFALEETKKKSSPLNEEFKAENVTNLETKLSDTTRAIKLLRKKIEIARNSDLDLLMTKKSELNDAREVLQKLLDESSFYRNSVKSLSSEHENVKKEHLEIKEKDAKSETLASNLNLKLQSSKAELEMAILGESKVVARFEELTSTLKQLSSESENVRKKTEAMKKESEELMLEAEAAKIEVEETNIKLNAALAELEEAKNAEVDAQKKIKILFENTNQARTSTSDSKSNSSITVSTEELESLNHKEKECQKLAEIKIAAAVAQMEAVRASENEATEKIEAIRKEAKKVEEATQDALKIAKMAEAATMAIGGEVKRRQREREKHKITTPSSSITGVAKPNVITIESIMANNSSPTTTTKKTGGGISNLSAMFYSRKKPWFYLD